eukprot:CAMPEP_0118632244 /NCGR_PEP_ID=MMETSP0785-20121206/338_1 /TAXON_ID=91992 /ORGANISM="Bolidomonas pacifica, Strain CCMP 1866" /LENGTH=36 /DNA_ID= /DNA_START= /DNA_END= /DNA_ORIENTATION=
MSWLPGIMTMGLLRAMEVIRGNTAFRHSTGMEPREW